MQNIGADNAGDVFYRYKMPKLMAKVEGRGNGIKTNIVNNVDIAQALDRPPTYTIKHFGCELGAQTNFDVKTGTSIVNGAHDAKKLSEILELFIKKYVQCHNCGNPETVIKIKRGCIHLKCKACGHTSDVDMREKLTTFILKNPPENVMSKAEAKIKKAERERVKDAEKQVRAAEKSDSKKEKKRKDSKKAKSASKDSDEGSSNGADEDGGDDDDDDDTVWATDISAEAQAAREAEQLTAAAAMLIQSKAVETAKENSAAEAAAEDPPTPEVEEPEAEEDDERSPVEILRDYMDSKPAAQVAATLESTAVEGGVVGKMKLFYEALLGEWDGKAVERIQSRETVIVLLGRSPQQQASQLIALEWFITQVAPARKPEMPFVLKMMYEEDLIDDAIIVGWGEQDKIAKKHGVDAAAAAEIREICAPVLEWLQEESDDEDDDDE